MRIYRNVNLPIQIGCEVDDKIAEQLLKKIKDENFETRFCANLKLLRMTDTLLEENVHNLYSKIDSLFPAVYTPPYFDYETDDTMEDADGNEITYDLD